MPDQLERTLTFPTLLLIAVNTILGTGVFFLPAVGVGEAGVASLISWLIISTLSLYLGAAFAELSSMYPSAGGIYEFCKQAFGSFPSFIIGWGTLMAGNVTIAMLIVGAVRYLNPNLPEVAKIGISLLFVVMFNYIAYKGMDVSAVMLTTFSLITLGSLLGVVIPGYLQFDPSNFTPFIDHSFTPILVATFLIAETFFGWEAIAELAEETKNARSNIPRALLWSTLLVALIAVAYTVSAIGGVGAVAFGAMEAPIAELAGTYYGMQGQTLFTMLVYLSIIGSVAGFIVATPRLILSLAEDKLFIAQLAAIHPEYKTPHKAILFQTILTGVLVIVGSGSYETLLELLLPLVLLLYATVLLSLVVLRHTKPDHERPFRAPGGSWMPIIVALALVGLITFWLLGEAGATAIFTTMLTFVFLGVPVYFLLLFYYNPSAIITFSDKISTLSHWLENVLVPPHIRNAVLDMFSDLEGKTVLEFGSGVGTLTLALADRVGPDGHIYATDFSEANLAILEERIAAAGHDNIELIHDEHQVNRVHPSIENVDIVFSVGMLSYIQDTQKVLSEIRTVLPDHGKVCFVEYVDFFTFLPDPPLLDDHDELEATFSNAGFSVQVKRKNGVFWNYLIVYGIEAEEDIPYV